MTRVTRRTLSGVALGCLIVAIVMAVSSRVSGVDNIHRRGGRLVVGWPLPRPPAGSPTPPSRFLLNRTILGGRYQLIEVHVTGPGGAVVDSRRELFMPLWHAFVPPTLVIAPCAIVIALTERRHSRRLRSGRCVECGYDLRASAGRCPECGTSPTPAH